MIWGSAFCRKVGWELPIGGGGGGGGGADNYHFLWENLPLVFSKTMITWDFDGVTKMNILCLTCLLSTQCAFIVEQFEQLGQGRPMAYARQDRIMGPSCGLSLVWGGYILGKHIFEETKHHHHFYPCMGHFLQKQYIKSRLSLIFVDISEEQDAWTKA